MSIINLQGKSTLGAFVKSPFGARMVNQTGLDYITNGETILSLGLNFGSGLLKVVAFQACSMRTTIYQDGTQFAQTVTNNISATQNPILGARYFVTARKTCQRTRLSLRFLMPDLTGIRYASFTFGTGSFQGSAGGAYPAVFFSDAVDGFLPVSLIGTGQIGTSGQTIYATASAMSPYSNSFMNIAVGAYNELTDGVPLTGLDRTASSFTYSFSDVTVRTYS